MEGKPVTQRFPNNPCLHLNKTPLQNWKGLLFAGKRNIAKDLAAKGEILIAKAALSERERAVRRG